MRLKLPEPDQPDLEVSSLIDMVFLLLVYFLVTCSLVKSEGDLGIRLPGIVQQAVSVDMPDEQMIEVRENGEVVLNGRAFEGVPGDPSRMPELEEVLGRYKLASDASHNKALITIWAADKARHQRVIDVMNACAAAGIENITFTAANE